MKSNDRQGALVTSSVLFCKPRLLRSAGLFLVGSAVFNTCIFNAHARDYFNPAMLEIDAPHQEKTDLSVFEIGMTQAPGVYRVDVYLNNTYQSSRDVNFQLLKTPTGEEKLQPCMTLSDLDQMQVNVAMFPKLSVAEMPCVDWNAIPQAETEFLFNLQQLSLSIPQIALVQKAQDSVAESEWNQGIPAFLLNYSLNGTSSYGGRGDAHSQFVNLRPGINIGPWRLRNYTVGNQNSDQQKQWDVIYNYASRDIVSLKSQLIVGDSSSPSDVFDSVPFQGVQLASDQEMLPESIRGYAPTVRGIARTNALVVVRQNGYVIYQRSVAPGGFEINDIYPTGGNGDLNVTIKETDNSEQQLTVPFASLPILQREGQVKYALTLGRYRSYDNNVNKTPLGQGSIIYGLPYGLTGYGGGQFADQYQSLAVGLGRNFGQFGALSIDTTQARAALPQTPKSQGGSWRLRYSKNFVETGTMVTVAGHYSSSNGFYTLPEVLDAQRNQAIQSPAQQRRNRSELIISQNLWQQAGTLSLNMVREDYWNTERTLDSIDIGYNNSWSGINYSIHYSYNKSSALNSDSGRFGQSEQLFSLNLSMPLGRTNNTYVSYNASQSKQGGNNHRVGLNSSALADNKLNWGLSVGRSRSASEGGSSNSGNANIDYRGAYAQTNAGYAYDTNSQFFNYGVQGGVIAHEHGVTFGQPLSETVALINTQGVAGIGVSNQSGVETDWNGYAISPYVAPYRKNVMQLNTENLPDNVEITLATQYTVPTRGAVVTANFDTQMGYRAIMTLKRPDGSLIPFGAKVSYLGKKRQLDAIVGEAGQVYLVGLQDSGVLNVQWGNSAAQQCNASYSSLAAKPAMAIHLMVQQCK